MMTTIIGRGHSGTRMISATLQASGVFMGIPLNETGDLIPSRPMYEACRLASRHAIREGGSGWNFSDLLDSPISSGFESLVREYLGSVLESREPHRGWKLPETILALPWIVRMFPDVKYIYLIRDPRDCILKPHKTDCLWKWGVMCSLEYDERRRRAVSWKYQHDIVAATPKPAAWIEVRFEDFISRQEETLQRLEGFLEIPLAKIPVRPEAVGRWEHESPSPSFDFLEPAMRMHGYDC